MKTGHANLYVDVYQSFDDVSCVPFVAKVLNDLGSRWLISYKNKHKTVVERNINKACCSTEAKKSVRTRKTSTGVLE
jgi:hypothetical protein